MRPILCSLVLVVGLAATPALAQNAGVTRDGLSSNTLILHLVVDLLATMVVVGHATMYGSMLMSDATTKATLESGMGAWPTITLTAVAGTAALAAGAVGLASGDEDARTISIVSTVIGSAALACAGLDLTLTLLGAESATVSVWFGDGERLFAGVGGRF